MEPFKRQQTFIALPYPEKMVTNQVRRKSDVLIFGTHTSAIDALNLVRERDCRVTMVSPSGIFPSASWSMFASDIYMVVLSQYTTRKVVADIEERY